MKKIALLVLLAVVLSLFGCSAPTEPKESNPLSGGLMTLGRALSEEGFDIVINANHRRGLIPKNMVMWNDTKCLGLPDFFEFSTDGYSAYYYKLGVYAGYFYLYCYHDGVAWPDGELTVDQFTPTSISEKMTDMLNFPSDGKTMYVISRNGFDYCYNKDGTLERIQWHIDNIRYKLVFKFHVLTTEPDYITIIHRLLSTDDDVAFAAMDEIIDKLSNRPPYVPKETTAESTPAQ